MKNEFEARILEVQIEPVRKSLMELGFVQMSKRFLMKRQTFDFPIKSLGSKKWARVRNESMKTTMTVKEVRGNGIDDVYEEELEIKDFDSGVSFLLAMGMIPGPFQENYREEWIREEIYITIDEWPTLPPFLEIEGPSPEAITRTSLALGFNPDDSMFGSVDHLYEKYHGINATDFNAIERLEFED